MTMRSKTWSPLVGLSLAGTVWLLDPSLVVSRAEASLRSSTIATVEASEAPNQIDGLTVEEGKDGTTTLRLQGTDKPTFNVYRLPDPHRLVVDISRARRGKVVPRLPLDTWAAGRLTVEDVREKEAQLVRLMVQLKREASYIVVPDGSDLVITITPQEVPPEQYFARKSAAERREEIEAEKASARALKAQAAVLQRTASQQAQQAERRLQIAKERAAVTQRAEARARAAEQAAAAAMKEARTGKASLRRELKLASGERQKAQQARQEAEQALVAAKLEVERDRKAAKAARQRAAHAEHRARAREEAAVQTLAHAEAQQHEAARRLDAAARKDKAAAQQLEAADRERRAATRARRQAAQALTVAEERSMRATKRRKLEKELEAARAAEVAAQTRAHKAVLSRRSTEQSLVEAKRALRTERDRVAAIQVQLAAKDTALAHARNEVAQQRQTAATARQDAQRARQTAAQVRSRAEQALVAAEQAIAKAQAQARAATIARERAEKGLKSARTEAAAAKRRGDQSKILEQAVAEARAKEQEARARQAEAQRELAELSSDRDALAAKLQAQQKTSARLEKGIEEREERLQNLEREVTEARRRLADTQTKDKETAELEARRLQATVTVLETQVERLKAEASEAGARAARAERRLKDSTRKGVEKSELTKMRQTAARYRQDADRLRTELEERQQRLVAVEGKKQALSAEVAALDERRSTLAAQGKTLEAQNARARRALEDAESRLGEVRKSLEDKTSKLVQVEKDVEQAQARLGERLRKLETTRSPSVTPSVAPQPAKALARVTDVRFEDSPEEERVVIDVDGPIQYEGATLAPTLEMIRLDRITLPSSLERSLDTTRFQGPIKTVTSFAEGGQVKVIVATRQPATPVIEKRDGALVWRFPRAATGGRSEVVSLAGSKVSGFTSSTKPKMMAPAPTANERQSRGRWRGERIDIELQQAPIKDVLLLFSDIGRVNIIAGRGVEGVVTMKLTGVPWDQALDIILRSLNLGMVREGNVLRVATLKDLEDERREAIERAKAQVQLKPLETRLIPVSYATAQEMQGKVSAVLSSRGSVTTDTRTNMLIVMDVAENIALAEELVGRLDSQTPQVLIEARIVEARTNFLRQLGIQWGFGFIASPGTGNPTGLLFPNSVGIAGGAAPPTNADTRGLILPGAAANPNYAVDLPAPVGTGAGGAVGFSFGNINGTLQTNLRLSAAEDTGEVRIISAPKIVTLDNTAAQIEQGVQIPISQVSAQGVNTRYVNATLALKVTPHVTNEGAVLLDVTVQKNEADFVNTGARGDPTILTKQAQSRMLVNDGDTAVIGGIYTRSKSVNFKKVPWIADIPIIGWFFKNKTEGDTRTEVLIFLTPKIVNRASSIGG